ncbi:MAG: phosphatase PAP2 family protein [Polyangia bacterium]|jgi:membrane-associated phospholipid phosphatase|nr:phosphatase PAP2 family protein [Polyangia bacterium]
MSFFQRYSSEDLAAIRFKGAGTTALDDEFLIRPEEVVASLFLLLLLALSLGSGAPVFEPIESSQLTYNSTKIFSLLLLAMLFWTLGQRITARIRMGMGAAEESVAQDREAGRLAWARVWRVTRDWLPAVMSLGIYESLKHLHLNEIILWLGNSPKDDLMIRIDQVFFGGHASVWMQSLITPAFTFYMLLVYYVGYYLYPAVVGVVFYLFRPRVAFRELVLAFLATTFIGYTIYILVPVAGPRFELQHLYETTFVDRFFLQRWQEQARFDYDCFPSLHTAVPLVVNVIAFRHVRWLGYLLLPFVVSTVFSTLYLQMHYLIDVVAGVALVPFAVAIGVRGDKWWAALMAALGRRFPGFLGAVSRQSRRGRVLARVFQVLIVGVAIYWMRQLIV